MTILSGVPAHLSIGAGRLALHLEREVEASDGSARLVVGGNKSGAASAYRARAPFRFLSNAVLHFARRCMLRIRFRELCRGEHLVLLHFQDLGTRWCEKLVRSRSAPTWIYVLDASIFCIRSYNHISGENGECLRCLGGKYENAAAQGCRPAPNKDPNALGFLRFMAERAEAGDIRFLVQNQRHAGLVKAHFGPDVTVGVVGLWTIDMEDLERPQEQERAEANGYDVVYHGSAMAPKGVLWSIEVARHCPDRKFLFPCRRPEGVVAPDNCSFVEMSWETGLKDEVLRSRLTLVPSLWSAPIEGALVKSIIHAPRVAVASVPGAYSSELDSSLVCHLDPEPETAAGQLGNRLNSAPSEREQVESWRVEMLRNRELLDSIRKVLVR